MNEPTVWCPSCGDEYVAGSRFCTDCRVALVPERPQTLTGGTPQPGGTPPSGTAVTSGPGLPEGYVEVGSWPPLAAVMLMRRLQDADVPVAVQWSDPRGDGLSLLGVPAAQQEFADAVIRELPIEDELPQETIPGYVERIETRLTEVALLLDELRTLPEFGEPRS